MKKRKRIKKVISMFLAMVLCLSMVTMTAFASEQPEGQPGEAVQTAPADTGDENTGDTEVSDEGETPNEVENSDEVETLDEVEAPDEVETPDEVEDPEEVETPDEVENPEEAETPDEVEAPEEVETSDEVENPDEAEIPDEVETPDETEPLDGAGESGQEGLNETLQSSGELIMGTGEELPEEVKAFLEAVKGIQDMTELTEENYEQLAAVNAMYEALVEEGLIGEDSPAEVLDAQYAYQNMLYRVGLGAEPLRNTPEIGKGYKPHAIYYDDKGQKDTYLYLDVNPAKIQYHFTQSEDVTVQVGSEGMVQKQYTLGYSDDPQGREYLAEWIAPWLPEMIEKNPSIAGGLKWGLGDYILKGEDDPNYEGYPALNISFTGWEPGNTTITIPVRLEFYWNDGSYWSGGYKYNNYFNGWVERIETLNITVKADYALGYNLDGGELEDNSGLPPTTATVANKSYSFNVTDKTPTKEGHTFKGWGFKDENGEWIRDKDDNIVIYESGGEVTLNWENGYGSSDNPVSKTLYAVWEKDESEPEPEPDPTYYTVTYTDGVSGEIVFPDQGYEGLESGDTTPGFVGTPSRDGYSFVNWKLEKDGTRGVKSTVNPGDANGSNEIIYTAIWKKNQDGPTQYYVEYEWTGLPENHGQTLPNSEMHGVGENVTVDTGYPAGKEIKVDGTTYVFSGWDRGDFTMPAGNVTIKGEWKPKTGDTEEPKPEDPTPENPKPEEPTPTPDPTPNPTPTPSPTPTPNPTPAPEVHVYVPETPLAGIPVEVPVSIPEETVPLAGLVELADEEVPLAGVPKTGDDSLIWTILTLISGAGLAWLTLGKKRKDLAE